MQNLNDMVLFAEVIEHGGFAAAGRSLGIPKSRISRRIARLELDMGVQLMQRSSRKLSLTPAGELFLRYCTEMRDAAQNASDALAQIQTEPHGTVRLSCPVTLAQSSLGPLLPVFMARYPRIKIDMRVINRPVDPVEDGVDLALRVRTEIENSATLVAKTFGSSRALLVASPTLLAQRTAIRTPADLSQIDTVAMSMTEGRSSWRLVGPNSQVVIHWHEPRYIADDLLTLLSAVMQGVGAAMLPDYMCRAELETGRLVELLPGWGPPPAITHAMFPARRALVPAVRVLLDFLSENLSAQIPDYRG